MQKKKPKRVGTGGWGEGETLRYLNEENYNKIK